MAEPQANYDWSQYANWEKFVTRSGQVVYKVPGTMFLYDPYLSSQKGKPVVFVDERYKKEDQKKAEKELKEQASPLNQAIPVVAGTAGIIGSKYAIDALSPTSALETAQTELVKQQIAQNAAKQTGQQVVGSTAAQPATANTANAFAQGATQPSVGATQIGTNIDGSAIMSDGSTLAADGASTMPYQSGATLGNILSAAAIAKGTYDSAKAFENGGQGIRTGTTQIGAGVGSLVGGPLGAGAGALVGNAVGYGLQDNNWKNNAALALTTGGMALPLMLARDKLIRPSTKQLVGERWNNLQKEGITGAAEAFAAGHQNADDSKWNFEEAQNRAITDPSGFRHVYGNYKTFGNDWNTYKPEQQDAIVKGLINAGLYESKKGDVKIKDEAKAQEIKNQVLSAAPMTTPAPAPQAQRSNTLSAGIGKDGKPINYSKGQSLTEQQGRELAKRLDARSWR